MNGYHDMNMSECVLMEWFTIFSIEWGRPHILTPDEYDSLDRQLLKLIGDNRVCGISNFVSTSSYRQVFFFALEDELGELLP